MNPVFNNKINEQTKTEDGRTVFLSRSVAIVVPVVAIVGNNCEPYVLLSQRGSGTPDFQNCYNLVCGYLDFNETLKDAVKRELWEETGLNVDDISQENIIRDLPDSPWSVDSTPSGTRQNVTMRFGLVLEYDSFDELPKLTNENSEPNEVIESVWVHENEVFNMRSLKYGKPKYEKVWAFNHYDLWREFEQHYTNL